jgi:adenine-specific DNA-methyltransferase
VLDFHLGSGTTAAAAHKLGRRYIGIEQMDYIETITVPRLAKVIAGEQEGISKSCGWQGGGEFVYCALACANQRFADAILAAAAMKDLASIWHAMREKAFLSYRIDPAALDGMGEAFAALGLSQQKRILLEMLDKNLLYVPLSGIDDADFAMSDADKTLNRQFFNLAATQT